MKLNTTGHLKAIAHDIGQRIVQFRPERGAFSTYLIALALVGIALLVRLVMAPIEAGLQYVTLFPAVALSAVIGGLYPGMFAVFIGMGMATFIFIPPYYTISLHSLQVAFWSNMVFLVDGIIVCSAIVAMQRYQGRLSDTVKNLKQVEHDLRDNQADLRHAQVMGHIGSWRLDVRRNELRLSEEAYKIFGFPVGTPLTYETFLSAVHPDDQDYVDLMWKAALRGEPYDIEHRIIVKGEARYIRENAQLEFDGQGVLLGGFGTAQDVTQSKLRQLENKRVIQTTSEGFWLCDTTGRILDVNESFCRMIGYTREELLAMHIPDLEANESPEEVARHIQQIIEAGHDIFETRHRCKNGSHIDLEVSVNRSAMHENVFIVFVRDITERKKTEVALRESEALLTAVMKALPVGVWVIDKKWEVVFGNDYGQKIWAGARYLGIEQFGENMSRRPESGKLIEPHVWAAARAIAKGKIFLEEEIEIECSDGTHKIILNSAQPFNGSDGGISGAIIVNQDITGRKKAELEKLREIDERFRGSLEQVAVGIVHAALDGRYMQVNRKFCEIVGYSRDELLNMSFQDITLQRELGEDFWRPLLAGEVSTFNREKCYVRKDQSVVWVNLTVSLLRKNDGAPAYFIGVVEDITERKQADSELERSRQLLRELVVQGESLREDERKRIAREVHDELGQILTALRMRVSLLRIEFGKHDGALLEKIDGVTELLDQSIQCARDVVTNLRPAALDMGVIPAVRWLCDEFIKHTGTPCVLHAPEEEINLDEILAVAAFRVVQESLTNVARYAEASRVEISLGQDAGNFYMTVKDNGKGFDYPTISNRKSFGLLGIRERAIALGGAVNIESALQQGTQIMFVVPNKQAATDTKGENL